MRFITKRSFGNGRVNSLEEQAALPITSSFEMGSGSISDAVSRIAGDKNYQAQFMEAFKRPVNEQDLLQAIAAYQRTLASFDSTAHGLAYRWNVPIPVASRCGENSSLDQLAGAVAQGGRYSGFSPLRTRAVQITLSVTWER